MAIALAPSLPGSLTEARSQSRGTLTATLDSLARAHAGDPLVAGVAVGVVHRGDTLLLGGYGLADLEWSIPMPDDAVFEIGSITKQFTAVAVLQLAEEGRLDLDADFTTYLPDYDTRGHRIPLRRLLDHTSGIKGYTELPAFRALSVRSLPRDSLVALFQAAPPDFEPGTAMIYNNSAYFLLGLIIEKVSGQPYEEYVEARIFRPLGMERSSYCRHQAVVERRARGYDQGPGGLVPRAYLDHLWPYAAGSLCSTVGDLVRWNQALHGGEVLSAASYAALVTPRPLEDGTPIRYAMGLLIQDDNGRRTIAHGGGINGFLSEAVYHPDEDLLVVVLQNSATARSPGTLARALVDAVLGEPAPPPGGGTFPGDPAPLVGTYRGPARGMPLTMEVWAEGGGLALRPAGAPAPTRPVWVEGLRWRAGNVFFSFELGSDGRGSVLRVDQGSGLFVLRRVEG